MNKKKCVLIYCFDDDITDACFFDTFEEAKQEFFKYTGVSYEDFVSGNLYSSIYHGTNLFIFSGTEIINLGDVINVNAYV